MDTVFDLSDMIVTYLKGGEVLADVLSAFGDYVAQETLSRRLVTDAESFPGPAHRPVEAWEGRGRVCGGESAVAMRRRRGWKGSSGGFYGKRTRMVTVSRCNLCWGSDFGLGLLGI